MNVLMPQLGETVAEGTVAAWHKKAGDEVAKDEILLDVETDKAATEVPAPITGVITSVLVQEGETVDVGTVLAVINGPDAAETETETRITREEGDSTVLSVTMETGVVEKLPGDPPAAAARFSQAGQRLKLSPVVRRLIAEHRLDAQVIPGSGRDGRITRNDVMAFIEAGPGEVAAPRVTEVSVAPAAESAAPGVQVPADRPRPAPAQPAAQTFSDGDRVPFDRIRRVTAEHMVRSKATSPHVLQAVEVDFSAVDRVRSRYRESWRADHGFSLTYLPFIARATCLALRDFPRLNGSVDGDALVLHKRVNLSIAVDLNFEGLVAPVIPDAGGLTVSGLAHRIHSVSARAREGQLTPDEFTGGTYTLSNNGSFGTLLTAAIINQPQVGVLSIDAIKKRPVVVESPAGDSIAIRPVGILSQSFDHRAVDGSYSAAFLHKTRTLLEDKDWSAEL